MSDEYWQPWRKLAPGQQMVQKPAFTVKVNIVPTINEGIIKVPAPNNPGAPVSYVDIVRGRHLEVFKR